MPPNGSRPAHEPAHSNETMDSKTRTGFELLKRSPTKKPHGVRARYVKGCRCVPCRAANSRYATGRELERLKGNQNEYQQATKARSHLLRLQKKGVGYKEVAKRTAISASIILNIRKGTRKNIRALTARKILAVTADARAAAATVPAAESWRRLRWLIEKGGFTKTALARMLGSKAKVPALQVQKDRVLVKTARKIQRLYDQYNWPSHRTRSKQRTTET